MACLYGRGGKYFPMKKHSHVLPPVLVPEPAKVNPLGLAGGKEESLFQKELSEGILNTIHRRGVVND